MNNLKIQIMEIKRDIKELVESNDKLSNADYKLLTYVMDLVNKMLYELESDRFTAKELRYAYLSNLITDNYLSPIFKNNIGKRLIDAEKQYIEFGK